MIGNPSTQIASSLKNDSYLRPTSPIMFLAHSPPKDIKLVRSLKKNVGDRPINDLTDSRRNEITPTETKKRFESPNLSFNKTKNKLGEERRRHIYLVMKSLTTLISAIAKLSEFIDPVEEYLTALTDPMKFSQTAVSSGGMDLGIKVLNDCRRLLLAKMDHNITFYGIHEEVSEDYKKDWWRAIMGKQGGRTG